MDKNNQNILFRLFQYQKERFQLSKYVLLILVFSYSSLCVSAQLRNDYTWPSIQAAIIAFILVLSFFWQLRVIDEFKDYKEDLKFRPYRPVPRGLVSLKELAILASFSGLLQWIVVLIYKPNLIYILLVAHIIMLCASQDFFLRKWIAGNIAVYMLSHMILMPTIDFLTTAVDWRDYSSPPTGLALFLLLSYLCGIVLEIGRKIRLKNQEELGVLTYSAAWGIKNSVIIWLSAQILAFTLFLIMVLIFSFSPVLIVLNLVVLVINSLIGYFLITRNNKIYSKKIEDYSGYFVLVNYLLIGIVSMAINIYL